MTDPERFERVAQRLLDEFPGDERGKMLHSPGIKVGGKAYGFAPPGELIVKLPEARVQALIAGGEGQPCAPGGRSPMREWIRLQPADDAACEAYLREARAFVAAV